MDAIGVLIPSDRIARVIGKAGFGLKQIREMTGVKVNVQEGGGESDAESRRVDISGSTEQIALAFALVTNKAYAGMQGVNQTIYIPQDKAGAVVGKGGDNLKRVREECRVRVSLERDPVVNAEKGVEERSVVMSGEAENMRYAIRYVLGLGGGSFGMPFPGFGGVAGAPLAAAPGMTHVHAPSADPEEVQVHVHVPEHLAGAILGKAGAQVKQTAAAAGCKVVVSSRDMGAERRAVVIGKFGQVAAAQELLTQQLAEAATAAGSEPGEVQVMYLVRKEAAGVVIGKQGSTLTEIREKSGARIQLAREEAMGQRCCNISGSLEAVLQAETLIFELVRHVPVAPRDPQAGFGPGGMKGGSFGALQDGPGGRPGQGSPEEVSRLLVPAMSAGAIIGKQGSGLKQLRETCGVHVEMVQPAQAPEWPNDRVLTLKGQLGARQQAVEMVMRMSYQAGADSATLKMLVPVSQVGAVIGKQGSTLRAIREQCGVSTQVDKEEVNGDRLVSVTGPHVQVAAAARSVLAVLAGANPNGPGAEPALPHKGGCRGEKGGPQQFKGKERDGKGQQRDGKGQDGKGQRQAPQHQQHQQEPYQQRQQQQPFPHQLQQQQMLLPQQQPHQRQPPPPQHQQLPYYPQPPSNMGYPTGYAMAPGPWGHMT